MYSHVSIEVQKKYQEGLTKTGEEPQWDKRHGITALFILWHCLNLFYWTYVALVVKLRFKNFITKVIHYYHMKITKY